MYLFVYTGILKTCQTSTPKKRRRVSFVGSSDENDDHEVTLKSLRNKKIRSASNDLKCAATNILQNMEESIINSLTSEKGIIRVGHVTSNLPRGMKYGTKEVRTLIKRFLDSNAKYKDK